MSHSPFSEKLSSLQLAWDSVSSGIFKECAYKYYLSIIRGYTGRERLVDIGFGIFLHSAREKYYIVRANNDSHDDGVIAALNYVLCETWDQRAQRPWQGDERKNRYTLARTVVWYLDEWENDPLVTVLRDDGRPMVELSFRISLGKLASTGEEFILCGHLDRVADYLGQWWANDAKTTKYTLSEESRKWFFSQFTPDNQISLYSYAGKLVLQKPLAGVMIDGIQVAQGFNRFARAPIARTASQLSEWLDNFFEMLERADRYAQAERWPQNEKACFRCEFRAACSLPPRSREAFLEKNYDKRKWNPLEVRGE